MKKWERSVGSSIPGRVRQRCIRRGPKDCEAHGEVGGVQQVRNEVW